MLARLDQSLLVLIFRLELFLSGYVTDVANGQKLTVHVIEFTGFDADLYQNVFLFHHGPDGITVAFINETVLRLICLWTLP